MDVVTPIREPRPSLSQLKKFFLATPDWMLFGGHFDARGLFNDREYEGLDDEGVVVDFGKDRVRVVSHRKRATLRKDRSGFRLHTNCRVTFWGGCNVATERDTVATLMRLFGPHLLVGFAGTTNPRLMSAVIGTKPGEGNFFGRLGSDSSTLTGAAIQDAWFEAVKGSMAATKVYSRYRVIDETGQEWLLKRRKKGAPLEVAKGRLIAV